MMEVNRKSQKLSNFEKMVGKGVFIDLTVSYNPLFFFIAILPCVIF